MKQRVAGFTLIEMMVAVVIMAILMALAAPSFVQMIANNQITSVTNELLSDLALARSEAIKRGGSTMVRVCASSDGSTCTGSWSDGRLVYIDPDGTGTIVTTNIVRRSGSTSPATITAANFTTAGYLAYSSAGSVSSTALGTFTVCKSGYVGRVVSISTIGRSTLAKTGSNCS